VYFYVSFTDKVKVKFGKIVICHCIIISTKFALDKLGVARAWLEEFGRCAEFFFQQISFLNVFILATFFQLFDHAHLKEDIPYLIKQWNNRTKNFW